MQWLENIVNELISFIEWKPMTTTLSPAEFTIQRPTYDRINAVRWIFSHARQHMGIIFLLFAGAFGNAALAAVVPLLVGDAFNAMLNSSPNTGVLLPLALTIGGTQIFRGVLQLGRNFGAELLGQRLEREIRDEMYLSLLGKSMTFHNLQPVGDTMARATNDVREVNLMFSPGINLVIGSAFFFGYANYCSTKISCIPCCHTNFVCDFLFHCPVPVFR
jgi:ATP-binding cassette subfamily B protein